MTPVSKTMSPLEWALLIALSILWGGSFFFAEVALDHLPPLTLVFVRVALAAAALHLLILAKGQRMPRDGKLWASFAVMGLINNFIPFSLIFWGQTTIGGSLAAILNATTPIWTVLLAHWLTRDERMSANKGGGVVLGFVGVVVMIGPAALGGLGREVVAQLAVVAAAVSYGFAGIFGRRFSGLPPLFTATGQLTATSIFVLPVALYVDRPWLLAIPSPAGIASVLALALASTALAYILYFRILASAGATNVLLVTLLVPVSALVLNAGILGEVLEARQLAGMALIGLGLAVIDGRLLRRIRGREKARARSK